MRQIFFSHIIDPKENGLTDSLSRNEKAYSVLSGYVMKIRISRDPYAALPRPQCVHYSNANCACPAMDGIPAPARQFCKSAIKSIAAKLTLDLFNLLLEERVTGPVPGQDSAVGVHQEYRFGKLIEETPEWLGFMR